MPAHGAFISERSVSRGREMTEEAPEKYRGYSLFCASLWQENFESTDNFASGSGVS
jgi:hypothetical protein